MKEYPMKSSSFSATALAAGPTLLALTAAPATQAQQLTIGSPNVAVADPVVPPPPTRPCVVTLYTNEAFPSPAEIAATPPGQATPDFSNHPFTFTPPAACPGPWEKVVYSADFSVNSGIQYDRTAIVWLGGAVIFLGTTEEPNPTATASWHVERDLTDYGALFTKTQDGYINLGNWYDPNGTLGAGPLTGIYQASAKLYFYPGNRRNQGERPDQVLNLQPNSLAGLSTPSQQLAATFTLPTNVERAFLDVYAQNQSGEEFWYADVPDQQIATDFFDTFSSPYKEAEVTIDGQPADIVPAYPWIFTGGEDPILWQPIPGVQTLELQPYRVDLTPFVGVLSNGEPHTIAININGLNAANSSGYFNTAASLLLYLDHGSSHVTGAVAEDTLQATPVVYTVNDVKPTDSSGSFAGPISVTSDRRYTIVGTANTSHGTVTTRIDTTMAFSNVQQITYIATGADAGTNDQDIVQDTEIDKTTTISRGDWRSAVVLHEHRSYPLTFDINVPFYTGGFDLRTHADQEFKQRVDIGTGWAMKTAMLDNHRITTGTRHPYPTPAEPTNSSQSYAYSAPFGACYSRTITSALGAGATWPSVLTSVTDGVGCPWDVNSLGWNDQFADFASREFGATVKLLPW
jgi:hypothetical protein